MKIEVPQLVVSAKAAQIVVKSCYKHLYLVTD